MRLPAPLCYLLAPRIVPFVIRVAFLVVTLTLATQTAVFERWIESPLIDLDAGLTCATLRAFGTPAERNGPVVGTSEFRVEVVEGCTGIFVFVLLLAATLAFPARWRTRLGGVGAGAAIIFVLNWARIVTLYYLGRWRPDLFADFHLYVWQGATIVTVTLYWYVWALRFGNVQSSPRAAAT